MIKGVNKKVIEINNTDSIYFEKAVFYLRPEVRELPGEVSEREAERCVSMLGLETVKYKPSRRYGRIVIALMGVLAILALICVFLH